MNVDCCAASYLKISKCDTIQSWVRLKNINENSSSAVAQSNHSVVLMIVAWFWSKVYLVLSCLLKQMCTMYMGDYLCIYLFCLFVSKLWKVYSVHIDWHNTLIFYLHNQVGGSVCVCVCVCVGGGGCFYSPVSLSFNYYKGSINRLSKKIYIYKYTFHFLLNIVALNQRL